jgi:hypothetical protein
MKRVELTIKSHQPDEIIVVFRIGNMLHHCSAQNIKKGNCMLYLLPLFFIGDIRTNEPKR